MTVAARRVSLLTLLLCVSACGGSPVSPTAVCRRYASAYVSNGTPYRCSFSTANAFLTCSSGTTLHDDWQYASAADFVDEAQVPNRIRARTRTFSALGMVNASRTFLTDYRYDGSGRLIGRRRTNDYAFGSFELDAVDYTAWDDFGRPIAGTMHVGDRSGPLTFTYNDAAREVEASNGESVTLDVDGNIVREVVASGFGESGQTVVNYLVQSTEQVCK